jgi:glycosyltransferase involved in cell wall biosynthesis
MKILITANTSWFVQNFESKLIQDLQSHGATVVVAAPLDASSSTFSKNGVEYIEVAMNRRGLNPFFDVLLIFRLYRIFKSVRPDIIFHNTIKPVIYGSIAARLAKIEKSVVMIPGLGYVFVGEKRKHKLLRALVQRMYKFALKSASTIFFQNPDDKNYFLENALVPEDKVELTYGLGVDAERFRYNEPTRPGNSCVFILMSRMLWDKGVGEFVAAAKEVKQAHPYARFQLLGKIDKDNPNNIELKTIQEWESAGIIEYLGKVADVCPVLENTDVVVLPSYYREGIPNALMEGMAMGRPIITTDMPGCRETVIDQVNGILIPSRDVDALARAMEFMILHPERRIEMGRAGRNMVLEKFEVKKVNAIILKSMGLKY